MIIKLPIKPLSYNAYYRNTKSGHRVKTGAGLAYEEELEMMISGHSNELAQFGESLDLSKYMIKITIYNFKSDFYIKDGSRINLTAGDWDNPIKVLQDKLFKQIGIDDIFIKWGEVIDLPSTDTDGIIVMMEKRPLPEAISFEDFTIGEY